MKMESKAGFHGPIVLFDGYCRFCNFWVDFLIRIDKQKRLRFASAQSEAGRSLLARDNVDGITEDSVVVYDGGRFYLKSAAILQVARSMRGICRLGYVLVIIPGPLRDLMYDFIARHRYGWFGRRETCRVPTEADRERFLE